MRHRARPTTFAPIPIVAGRFERVGALWNWQLAPILAKLAAVGGGIRRMSVQTVIQLTPCLLISRYGSNWESPGRRRGGARTLAPPVRIFVPVRLSREDDHVIRILP